MTIGLTCFNAEDTIERAVMSAVNQTWQRKEILVVDDCSTDGSRAVLKRLNDRFPEIRVVYHETNKGFPSALNTLLEHASGEFIAFFDDDDESIPERVTRQYQRLSDYGANHEGACVFCYSNRDVIPAADGELGFQKKGIGRKAPEPFGPMVADYVLGLGAKKDFCWGLFGSCTLMARVDSFRRYQGFDERFRRAAELDFATRAAFGEAHFVSVNEALITQYLTPTADKGGNTDLLYMLQLLKKHKKYLNTRKAYMGAVANMYAWYSHTKARHMRGRMWRALAMLLFPREIASNWMERRSQVRAR